MRGPELTTGRPLPSNMPVAAFAAAVLFALAAVSGLFHGAAAGSSPAAHHAAAGTGTEVVAQRSHNGLGSLLGNTWDK
ncbi:hypothetical protein [Streptomyces sp. MST-110588]|uniref:hypothetical protein n=1 Tax=Streptomyces sp. MST-110588 TaxID=2833628 RepID=UPI001F5E306D|nr:hypothetical protein [Streptomyces sp. MST-110588]UNO41618.1 hypothetical protein KGS77_21285 [Streptomyces sp. MST-110588]